MQISLSTPTYGRKVRYPGVVLAWGRQCRCCARLCSGAARPVQAARVLRPEHGAGGSQGCPAARRSPQPRAADDHACQPCHRPQQEPVLGACRAGCRPLACTSVGLITSVPSTLALQEYSQTHVVPWLPVQPLISPCCKSCRRCMQPLTTHNVPVGGCPHETVQECVALPKKSVHLHSADLQLLPPGLTVARCPRRRSRAP